MSNETDDIKTSADAADRLDGVVIPAGYQCIVADPPWDYKTPGQIGKTLKHRPNRDEGESKHGAGSVARYGAMSMDELKAMPVEGLAADNAHLYLWVTNGFMEQAYPLARAWGFEPKTIITWTKTRKADGQPSMKMGYYYRGATEHVLFCVRGSMRLQGSAAPTAIFAPRLRHSQKPEEFYSLVDEQTPGPRLELFSRKLRAGWVAWGNEV
ncbi:MAG: MT-A70 family methyltransferase [Gammaproteobacteria bacterium]|nr:MT-A70 family methyltransferase [Gammaproteobacteria bacterium]